MGIDALRGSAQRDGSRSTGCPSSAVNHTPSRCRNGHRTSPFPAQRRSPPSVASSPLTLLKKTTRQNSLTQKPALCSSCFCFFPSSVIDKACYHHTGTLRDVPGVTPPDVDLLTSLQTNKPRLHAFVVIPSRFLTPALRISTWTEHSTSPLPRLPTFHYSPHIFLSPGKMGIFFPLKNICMTLYLWKDYCQSPLRTGLRARPGHGIRLTGAGSSGAGESFPCAAGSLDLAASDAGQWGDGKGVHVLPLKAVQRTLETERPFL